MPRQNIAFPYRQIPEGMVNCSDWAWKTRGSDGKVRSAAVDSWDYDSRLSISRTVDMNVPECLAAAGLEGEGVSISLVTILETGPAGYRWNAYQSDIPVTGQWSGQITIEIDSGRLAGALRINSDIVLMDPGRSSARMAASLSGSRLWSDFHQIDLEGSRARFPMDTLNFRKALPHLQAPTARWYLYWQPERLDGSFIGNVVLYLNSENKNFVSRVMENDPVSLAWLKSDVIRQMCSQLIESDEFIGNAASYAGDSVGGVVGSWLSFAFSGMSLEAVRALYRQNLSWFEARLLSSFVSDDG